DRRRGGTRPPAHLHLGYARTRRRVRGPRGRAPVGHILQGLGELSVGSVAADRYSVPRVSGRMLSIGAAISGSMRQHFSGMPAKRRREYLREPAARGLAALHLGRFGFEYLE